MIQINLEATTKRAIELMTEKGISKESIRNYSNFGFSVIISHFREMGIVSITPEILDQYVFDQKIHVKNGEMSYKHWKRLRRGAEYLKLCAEKDSIDIPNGTRWDFIKDYSRNDLWERPPSEIYQSDSDNIYFLVWKTGKAMEESDLTDYMTKRYKIGLKIILELHTKSNLEKYSEQLVENRICELHREYAEGRLVQALFQRVQKAAAFLKSMHDTGEINLSMLPRWGLREPIEPFKFLLDKYVESEKKKGVLCESSINEMKYRIRTFLFLLEDNGYDSTECFRRDIINNIINELVKYYSGDLKNAVKPVKKFLGFLFSNHYTDVDLRLAIPEFAAKKRTFHEGFSREEVEKLLRQPDCTTALGKRDYAIMIIVAQTGLRGCDTVSLKYENIDWRNREIRLIQRKTGKPIILPLEPESSNAIADYILNGRPESESPYIFISHKGMHSPLGCNNGVLIVSRHMKKAGIISNHRSVHALRRTFGTGLLQNEIPIDTIRQLLGHSNANSSKPYLSIDEKGLKNCALPLLTKNEGGESK